ncbi:MAG: DinB family protein [Acidobacteria bacterium]|nr:DinB family protein [Acidobacteriota bacterium]
MTPEHASMLLALSSQDAENESATTRKVIAAVPVDKSSYTPHPTSMTAIDLAWHIAVSEVWFLNGIANANFPQEDAKRPEDMKTSADVLAYYDANYGPALAKVKALSGEQAAKTIDFYGVFNLPGVAYLGFMIKHSCHHRGQLSAYLRPMGAKVPSIYGGSADEPFQMAAAS